MSPRLRQLPTDDASWAVLASAQQSIKAIQLPSGEIAVVFRPPKQASRSEIAMLLIKFSQIWGSMWLDRQFKIHQERTTAIASDPASSATQPEFPIANYQKFISDFCFSDPMYHIAFEISEVRDAHGSFSHLPAWGLVAALSWRGQFGDIRDALETHTVIRNAVSQLEKAAQGAQGGLKDSYQTVIADLRWQRAMPEWEDQQPLGRRGGAFKDEKAAKRGWLIRDLDVQLPPFENGRYAVISRLLDNIGLTGISPALVRSVLLRGRT